MSMYNTLRHAASNNRLFHTRLRRRLILYPIIAVIMFAVVIYDALHYGVSPLWILVGGLLGLGIGYLVGQIFKLSWNEDSGRVVMGIDRLSILLIVAYVGFRYASKWLIGEFLHGEILTVATYSLLGGILFGRMIGVLHKAGRVLENRRP